MEKEGHTGAIGDRVRVKKGERVFPRRYWPFVGKKGTVIRLAPGPGSNNPLTVLRLKDGTRFACYEDEMESIKSGDSRLDRLVLRWWSRIWRKREG